MNEIRVDNAVTRLARHVADASVDIEPDTRTVIRNALIDTLGCILLGAGRETAQQTLKAVSGWGHGSSRAFGTAHRLPPPWAAMVNATAAHAFDFDDWEAPGNTHPSAVLFPAMLAAADGRALNGSSLMEGYIVGFEVIARLGEGLNYEHYDAGWHSTATLGAIGAAASVARIKGLDAAQTGNALSIAASQAVGYTCQFGSNAKPLQAGFAAKTGVVSAALAAEGLTGQTHVLDGKSGITALMAHDDTARFEAAMARMGQTHALTEHGLLVKAYPSCGYTHRLVDCALAIRGRDGFDANSISGIRCSLPDFHAAILPFQIPTKTSEALFSAQFCIALALKRGRVTLADFDERAWTDNEIARLNRLVELEVRKPRNPDLNYDPADPDWLIVEFSDGRTERSDAVFPIGAPQNPLSAERILAKFRSNACLQESVISSEEAEAFERLKRWDTQADVIEIVDRFGEPT